MADQIERFLDDVKEQIRWKQARKGLEVELRTHLLDQRDALIAQGMEEDAAAAESVRQMGDPVEVGIQLDRAHRPKPQWELLTLVGIILCAGLIIQSTVMQELYVQPNLPNVFVSVITGAALMMAMYFLDYQWLGRRPVLVYIIGLTVLLGMICYMDVSSIPFSSIDSPTARLLTIYVGLIMPVFCYTPLVWSMRKSGWRGFILSILAAAPMTAAALMLHSMTAELIAYEVCLVVLSVAVWTGWDRISRRSGLLVMGLLLAASAAVVIASMWSSPYAMSRLEIALHPELDPLGTGFGACQTRLSLAQAKLWGSSGYDLPFGNNDLWLAWVICRLGWAAGVVLILLLALLFFGATRRCVRQRGSMGRMLSFSVLAALAGESASYILFNLGVQLTGPWVLPLLSTGGSYMMVNLLLVGLMLGVFRFEQLPVNITEKNPRQMPTLILWQDGDLVLRLSQLRRIKIKNL